MPIPDEIKTAVEAATGTGLDVWLSDKPALRLAFERIPELKVQAIDKVREHPAYIAAMDLLDKVGENLDMAQGIVDLIRELTPLIAGAVGIL